MKTVFGAKVLTISRTVSLNAPLILPRSVCRTPPNWTKSRTFTLRFIMDLQSDTGLLISRIHTADGEG